MKLRNNIAVYFEPIPFLGIIIGLMILFIVLLWPALFLLMAALFVLLSFVVLNHKWQLSALCLLLIVFYFFPYSSISPSVRAEGGYFTIYQRNLGPLSAWDVFIILSLLSILFHRLKEGRFVITGIPSGTWLGILGCYATAFLIGLLHVQGNLLSYGMTDLSRPFVALQPILYMFAVYWITESSIQTKKQISLTIRFLKWLSIGLIIYGVLRGIFIFTGKVETMWPFGLPIILYDQLMMLFIPVFWGLLSFLAKEKTKQISLFWTALASIFIIISARRFNYFLLIAGIVLVLFCCYKIYNIKLRYLTKRMLPLLAGVLLFILVMIIALPGTVEKMGYTFRTLNFFKMTDLETGSDIRRAEINNLFLNLKERPYSYLFGFGLGTTWRAIKYQPYDSFSFTKKTLVRTRGWIPQFHLPYISLLFRYGIAGSMLYWLLCFALVNRYLKKIKNLQSEINSVSFYLAGVLFIFLILPNIGDSVNPTAPILVGFLVGLLERTFHLFSVGEVK